MTDCEWRPIGSLIEPVSLWNPLSEYSLETFRYIELGAVDQETKAIKDIREIACSEAPSRARQIVKSDDVLVSTVRPNLNGVAKVPNNLDLSIASTGFCVLRPKNSALDSNYLFHWVKSPQFVADMVRKATGASYPAVSDKIILASQLPYCPLPKQRRIAAILDQADALRAKRREALAQLDSLTQSIFVEMFGNPISNEKSWPLERLDNLATIERGKFTPRPRNDPNFYGGCFPFVQTGDISNSDGRLKKWSQTLNERGKAVSRSFSQNTVVIAIVGATLGATAILDIEVYCPDSIIGLVPKPDESTAEYIDWILRYWRPIFVSQAPETARANMNLESLRPLQVPNPPIELQREFAQKVASVEDLKTNHRLSLKEFDKLFASLQHQAFRGEL